MSINGIAVNFIQCYEWSMALFGSTVESKTQIIFVIQCEKTKSTIYHTIQRLCVTLFYAHTHTVMLLHCCVCFLIASRLPARMCGGFAWASD